MKVVIYLNNDSVDTIREVIEHFVSYNFSSFIVFTTNVAEKRDELNYFKLNNIKVVFLNKKENDSTSSSLLKIKGSLSEVRFFMVYNVGACEIDLDKMLNAHKKSQRLVTLAQAEERLLSLALFEEEIFDYLQDGNSLEQDTIKRIGEDCELSLLKFQAK